MRKQEKYIICGTLLLAAVTAIVDLWLQSEEQIKKGDRLTWETYNGLRALKVGTLGGITGGVIGNEIYNSEFRKKCMDSFSSDRFIRDVLKNENTKSNVYKHAEVKIIKSDVKNTLFHAFSDDLVAFPEDVGSLAKGTALESTYDIDIVLPIKRYNRFSSLSNMSTSIHNKIENLYRDKAVVTKKKKATNILFCNLSTPISVDVVYGRETGNYLNDRKLNLYTRPDYFWQSGKHFKTDIGIQKYLLVNKPKVREVIKAFKLYFKKNYIPVENVLIEQLVFEAMSHKNYGTNSSVTENFLNCMDYISQKMDNNVIRDYANSNNNLLQKINNFSRGAIIDLLNSDLEKIEVDSHYLREAFQY